MVDLDCKTKMVTPDMKKASPKLSKKLHVSIPSSFRAAVNSPANGIIVVDMRSVRTVLSAAGAEEDVEFQRVSELEERGDSQTGFTSFRNNVPVRLHHLVGPKTVRQSAGVEAAARVADDEPGPAHRYSLRRRGRRQRDTWNCTDR
ncbi:hypothetical protein L1049_011835 [Liquidambar formosana]|uniref:Nematode resistance protein-like HSPRO1 N-terminal domain-containing protein n=1 Tax=Liquidambar formosana TaxID=63359 RepID=A0AAP0X039_LIQFO